MEKRFRNAISPFLRAHARQRWTRSGDQMSFRNDERGSATIFFVQMFLIMFVAAGMSVDFIQLEARRADLQDAVDRGVLAAAATSQTLDAEDVVENYISTRFFTDEEVSLDVDVDAALNYRRVDATASYSVSTWFLKVIGIDTLFVSATGAAEDRKQKVEISLALDISGSMAGSKLTNLKSAANEFVETVMSTDREPTLSTSLNLIPWTGHVALPQEVFDYYIDTSTHSYSRCIEFESSDFDTTALPAANSAEQVPEFYLSSSYASADIHWCPEASLALTPLAYDPDDMIAEINALDDQGYTATHIGMKWALGLLDPGAQDMVTDLVTAGVVDSDFDGRPFAWDEEDSLKVIILMSDGATNSQYRPYSWWYDEEWEIENWEDGTWNISNVYGSGAYLETSSTTARSRLSDLCDLAKNNGVIVFTIAFETYGTAESDMQDCASSMSHFYDSDQWEVSDTFRSIAATITKLKIVE